MLEMPFIQLPKTKMDSIYSLGSSEIAWDVRDSTLVLCEEDGARQYLSSAPRPRL
jgi:hypothetical protein